MGKWTCCKEVSEAKLVFPDIETSKPVGPHEVGHCLLKPPGYFYAEIKNSVGALSVVCSASCPPSAYASASRTNL